MRWARGVSDVAVITDVWQEATPNEDSSGFQRRGGLKYDQDKDREVKTWWDKPSRVRGRGVKVGAG